jgi:5-methylcytosine-specific restriction endonuclease McrA
VTFDQIEEHRDVTAGLDYEAHRERVFATPDPKPAKRHVATRREWAEIREWFEGSPCWVCSKPYESLHHILPRDGGGPYPGGDDVIVNLAPLCGDGTRGCHGLVEAGDRGVRARLRSMLTDANLMYLERRLGAAWEAWLDGHYPLAREAA